jgi:hypothetical protein
MRRFFGRGLGFDLAATLLVVVVAVSVADIDDYDMHSQATLTAFDFSPASAATPEILQAKEDSDSGHHCSCLLCVMTLPDSFGPKISPPFPCKLSTPPSTAVAGSPHLSEIFHPPPA